MNRKKLLFVIVGLYLLLPYLIYAQPAKKQIQQIRSNFLTQLNLFPQEKLHLHTDRSTYLSGEKIWYRAYLVDGVFHLPDMESRYMYVELIDPLGSVVNNVTVKADTNNILSGYLNLPDNLPLGDYTLRAYTKFMLNLGDDYLFEKNIRIVTPESATTKINLNIEPSSDNQIKGYITFRDLQNNPITDIKTVKIKFEDKKVTELKKQADSLFHFSFKPQNIDNNKNLLLEAGYYKQFIPMVSNNTDFDVSFFPEGGNLLAGTNCKVAFKAINTLGLHEDISGYIIDNNNDTITNIQTSHLGMGVFVINARKDANYFALCKNKNGDIKRIELPQATSGNTLYVHNTLEKTMVSVLKSADMASQSEALYLLVHTRGNISYLEEWDHSKEYIILNTKQLPSGVSHILLINQKMQVVSERLFFCYRNDQGSINMKTNKKAYKTREQVKINLNLSGKVKNSSKESFSISVTDNKDIQQDSVSSILSNLLLTSDLKGYIENPSFYIQKDKTLAINASELLMMTQGWRRYNIPSILKGDFEQPITPIELSQSISGIVEGGYYKKEPEDNAVVNIIFPESGYADITSTSKDGRFVFEGLEFQDSTACVIQAQNKKNKLDPNLLLKMDEHTVPKISINPQYSDNLFSVHSNKEYIEKADKKYKIENGIRSVYLDQVTVTAQKGKDKRSSSFLYNMAEHKIDSDKIEEMHLTTIDQLFYNLPGVSIVKDADLKKRVQLRQGAMSLSGPIYAGVIIDDMQLDDFNLDDINIYDIESLGIIKGPRAAILGSRGMGGAVIIVTKKGGGTVRDRLKTANYTKSIYLPGFQKPAEFYSPKYETAQSRNNVTDPDLRTTIYWNPNVTFDNSTNASIVFYTADSSTSYTVIIEGVTSEGKIVYDKSIIKVE